MKHVLAIAAAALLASSAARAAEPTAAGFWKQVDDNGQTGAWFYFVDKGNGVFAGRLVKMFPKPGEPNVPNCLKCVGDQKDAPMLGLVIVKNMKRSGLHYEGGNILDPRDGSIYQAQMDVTPDGQSLLVRGYLGIPMFGQTQTWARLPDNVIAAADIPPESLSPGLKPRDPPKPATAAAPSAPSHPAAAAAATPTKPPAKRVP